MNRFISFLGILGAVIALSSAIVDLYLGLTRPIEMQFAPIVTDSPFPSVGDYEWSPDGKQVIFRRGLAAPFGVGNGALYIMNADGSDLHPLPSTDILTSGANWSPDGQQIAYVWGKDRFGKHDVYVVNADGSQQRRVAEGGQFVGSPVWSSDGKYIAFRARRNAANDSLLVVHLANENVRLVATGADPYSASYSWSPDSKRIAYVAKQGDDNDIFIWDIDTGQTQILTHNDVNDDFPAWSPSGNQLAFVSEQGKDRHDTIYTVNADGSDLIQVTGNDIYAGIPMWSPDGQQIAFAGKSDRLDSRFGIYITDLNGKQAHKVKSDEGYITNITWLTSTNQIAYASGTGTFDYKYLNSLDLNTGLTHRIYPPAILKDLVCAQQTAANDSENISITISSSLPIPIQMPIVLDIRHEPFILGPEVNLNPPSASQRRIVELASNGESTVSWPVPIAGDHAYISVFIDSGEFPMSEKRCDIVVDKKVQILGDRTLTIQPFLQWCVLLGVALMAPWLYQHRSRTVLITVIVILLVLYWLWSGIMR